MERDASPPADDETGMTAELVAALERTQEELRVVYEATLESLLMQARRERISERLKEEGSDRRTHGWSQRCDELEAEPLSAADARHAAFPKAYLYKGHLTAAFTQLGNTPGVKQATAKMRKLVDSRPKDQEFVEFVNDYQVELLEDFLSRG